MIAFGETKFDHLIEGVYAHHYNDETVRQQIIRAYKEKYMPEVTPLTNPEQYDPLNPPDGWVYDPYYEMWIEY